mmetsp:Transcript_5931/g.16955  ORF Transcript_5931/g.16955 Transcript_5931/m.16955 type:complete len:202 (-) Transcript_5931:564-1169(-)
MESGRVDMRRSVSSTLTRSTSGSRSSFATPGGGGLSTKPGRASRSCLVTDPSCSARKYHSFSSASQLPRVSGRALTKDKYSSNCEPRFLDLMPMRPPPSATISRVAALRSEGVEDCDRAPLDRGRAPCDCGVPPAAKDAGRALTLLPLTPPRPPRVEGEPVASPNDAGTALSWPGVPPDIARIFSGAAGTVLILRDTPPRY